MKLSLRRERTDLVSISGWLFADLLLVLALVAMGAVATTPVSHRDKPGDGTARIEAVRKPRPTQDRPLRQRVAAPGLDRQPARLVLKLDADGVLNGSHKAIRELRRSISSRTQRFSPRRAGMVLAFGHSSDPSRGAAASHAVNGQLRDVKRRMFGDAVMKSYHQLSGSNRVTLEIYFVAERGMH